MFPQIQNIPTPILFIKRGTPGLVDTVSPSQYALDYFVAVLAQSVTESESGSSTYSLEEMITNGAQPTIQTEPDGLSNYALQVFINVAAQQAVETEPDGLSDYALQVFINVAAQQRTETEPDGLSDYALQSFVIP